MTYQYARKIHKCADLAPNPKENLMTTYQRTRRDAKKAGRECRKGDTLWTEVEVARNLAPYEDSTLLKEYKVTGTHPLLGGAMIGGHSVEWLVLNEGPVYTSRPAGVRAVHEPAPQVPAPLADHQRRPLTDKEIRKYERELSQKFGKKTAKKMLAAAGVR